MAGPMRGADVVAKTLLAAGITKIFTLSGNHIMPVFDATVGTDLDLIHVRHEAAAVHMADAWARLTGTVGIALVTGGPGHANAVGALYTALAAESPVVLLSGHAPLKELGRGSFQEMRQAEMAAPACRASWTATRIEMLGADLATAMQLAASGRPGPVHLSLPTDLLEAVVGHDTALPSAPDFAPLIKPLETCDADAALTLIASAERPVILTGPQMDTRARRNRLAAFESAAGVPVLVMASPRGINDPSLGAFAEVIRQADLVVLLGKALDFTLRFGDAPAIDPAARFVVIDPDPAMIERVTQAKGDKVALATVADPLAAIDMLSFRGAGRSARDPSWLGSARDAIRFRPPAWAGAFAQEPGKLHPIEVCRAVQTVVAAHDDAILVCDGGEIGQWPQSLVAAPHRVINGVAGSIGAALPFAAAAALAAPGAPVIAVMGDGTFGFHMAELDTAVRCNAPFVAIVGNDARWNAEHQIQVRDYGADRAIGCTLLPTRYDQVAIALGGHGEHVTSAVDLVPAIERALRSGKPACINVMIESVPAPVVKRA